MPAADRQPDATNPAEEYYRACASDLQGQLDCCRAELARTKTALNLAEDRERIAVDELRSVRRALQQAYRSHNQ